MAGDAAAKRWRRSIFLTQNKHCSTCLLARSSALWQDKGCNANYNALSE